jgi:hypothetical protein
MRQSDRCQGIEAGAADGVRMPLWALSQINDAPDLGSYTPRMNYRELVQLAHLCARNAHGAGTDEVTSTLWVMAEEYRAPAAELGNEPDIGEPPSRIRRR